MRKQKIFETPILLIAWKRPDKTKKILESIRQVKPRYFYVACDGKTKNNKDLNHKIILTRKILFLHQVGVPSKFLILATLILLT